VDVFENSTYLRLINLVPAFKLTQCILNMSSSNKLACHSKKVSSESYLA